MTDIMSMLRRPPSLKYMNFDEEARRIKKDLEKTFPGARFKVTVDEKNVSVDFIGGNRYEDVYPNRDDAVKVMVEVIRRTIPNYVPVNYTNEDNSLVEVGEDW